MMLSPFQTEKFTQLFQRFYDTNKNGVISKHDFADLLRQLRALRNWSAGDPRLQQAGQALDKAWLGLKKGADSDKDQQITMDEWQEYWAGFVAKSNGDWPADTPWVKEYASFWFDFMDTTGDNVVDEEEFAQVCSQFGATDAEARTAFKKMTAEPIDRETYENLWLSYMTSDNKSDAGNFVFGKSDW